jgi:hypothetical protein
MPTSRHLLPTSILHWPSRWSRLKTVSWSVSPPLLTVLNEADDYAAFRVAHKVLTVYRIVVRTPTPGSNVSEDGLFAA